MDILPNAANTSWPSCFSLHPRLGWTGYRHRLDGSALRSICEVAGLAGADEPQQFYELGVRRFMARLVIYVARRRVQIYVNVTPNLEYDGVVGPGVVLEVVEDPIAAGNLWYRLSRRYRRRVDSQLRALALAAFGQLFMLAAQPPQA